MKTTPITRLIEYVNAKQLFSGMSREEKNWNPFFLVITIITAEKRSRASKQGKVLDRPTNCQGVGGVGYVLNM